MGMDLQVPLSIYIHIPFCQTRCSYCAFNVYTDLEELVPAYMDALCRELQQVSLGNPHSAVHSVYFGGGTPSLVSPSLYRQVMTRLRKCFSFTSDAEISFESNPNDLSKEYLSALRATGINRLSIGMQSASAKILRLFDRRHDLQAVELAMNAARQAGFDNVNLDVIFGSPYETIEDWMQSVDVLLSLVPEHVSMYGLELKGGTALRRKVDSGEVPQPDDDLFADMYEHAADLLTQVGYVQYEISNWSRPGYRCRHNLQYWRNLPYLGIGAGSHGFAGGSRYSNIAAPGKYIASLKDRPTSDYAFPMTPAVAKATKVDIEDDLYETVMMGMRLTREGIHRPTFERRFGKDIVDFFPDALIKLERLGLLHVQPERIHLSAAGRLLSNAVIRELV